MGSLDFLLTGCSEPKQVTRLRELRALVAVYCGWDHPAKLALDRALAPGKSSALALEAVAEIDRLPALRRRRLLPSYGTLSVGGSSW